MKIILEIWENFRYQISWTICNENCFNKTKRVIQI